MGSAVFLMARVAGIADWLNRRGEGGTIGGRGLQRVLHLGVQVLCGIEKRLFDAGESRPYIGTDRQQGAQVLAALRGIATLCLDRGAQFAKMMGHDRHHRMVLSRPDS